MSSRALSKYLAFARVARRRALNERTELLGRVGFLAVVLAVFSALWRAVAESTTALQARPEAFVWYLAITEWIAIGTPQPFAEIEDDVKRGDIAYRLARPVDYLGSIMAEGFGRLTVRSPILGAAGCGFAWLYTGSFPDPSLQLFGVIPLVALASLVLMTFYVVLGLSAFWLGEVMPFYWIFQKLLFVLGGLMLPLALYPSLVLEIAAFTPFPRILYGPGSLVLGAGNVLSIAGWLLLWLVVALGSAALMFRRARRILELNGG